MRREPVRWEDGVIVVTGASSGIGRATALELARRGATVVAIARRQAALTELERVDTGRGRIEGHALDVTDRAAVRRLVADVVDRHGGFDAWVNNAAVNLFGAADVAPLDDTWRVVQANLGGYITGTVAALAHLREQGRGVIVNVSSVLGHVPAPYQAAYVATKHAIHGWTAALRQELRPDGIAVCEVAPGPVDTPLFHHAGNHMGREVVPLRPVRSPDRVARSIARTIERPRPLRPVGLENRVVLLFQRLSPGATERLAAVVTARNHFSDASAPPTPGNLHTPLEHVPPTITGDWRRANGRVAAGAVLGVGLLTIGLAAWRRRP